MEEPSKNYPISSVSVFSYNIQTKHINSDDKSLNIFHISRPKLSADLKGGSGKCRNAIFWPNWKVSESENVRIRKCQIKNVIIAQNGKCQKLWMG